MSIYFDLKTIEELIGDKYLRQQKQFTLEELSQYDGSNGKPAYVAVDGIVYDLTNVESWAGGKHFGLMAGKDLTIEFNSHHGVITKLSGIPKIGILVESKNKNTASKARVALVDTYDFSPDDWIGYITPLVDDALEEATGGVSLEHLFQKYIMVGILVGQGMTFKEATNEIENWEKSGVSKLLDKSKTTQGYQ
ncbi:cytochrome b5 domain-containing protein [Clostridium beijerinckii]|uniref:Cytochrome b5 n=2 Tax=Clostridium beijerinckii TaxID=1520 RepID=A0A1S9N4Y6_CLOBE|nr:cytochrome b5 domain-containing protein [Clostridium beijerinckii]MZK51117.1 cytochrome b5 [Clostridium beijerinckii]MZK59319.1 cytochrome b5 [Clostridium beijerinckii]MZK69438.1 cytochrome b5 [Clostridium beijerinckii]MZK74811.1 cytochrome b5 [Clostridium beijerinckii]MZK84529.1 cytochrome b5 [Clostridium beijerinckii]